MDTQGKIKAVVFDIDGTIADCTHRRHIVEGPNKDFNRFYELMQFDTPIEPLRVIHNAMVHMGYMIVFCTGRPERYFATTYNWIRNNGFENASEALFLMRDEHQEYTPDNELKEEMLQLMRLIDIEPIMVFDDRNKVVDMWRDNNITCLQAAPGDF